MRMFFFLRADAHQAPVHQPNWQADSSLLFHENIRIYCTGQILLALVKNLLKRKEIYVHPN